MWVGDRGSGKDNWRELRVLNPSVSRIKEHGGADDLPAVSPSSCGLLAEEGKVSDESVESEAVSGRTSSGGCKPKPLRGRLKIRMLKTRLAVAFAGGQK